jgi:hypothetical protein
MTNAKFRRDLLEKSREQHAAFMGCVAAFWLLVCCIVLYFLIGLNAVHGDFPLKQVLYAIPISLASWALCALLDSPHGRYRTVWGFVGCNIFATTAWTGLFVLSKI